MLPRCIAASSTGWIHIDSQQGRRIFIPATVNGHPTEVLLATGLPIPDIDRSYASSLGARVLRIKVGNLTLPGVRASVVDLAAFARSIGHPVTVLLGDDAFKDRVVDIDFIHRRIAFYAPSDFEVPPAALRIPITRIDGENLIPASIEGKAPGLFEMGLGNSAEMLVYRPYYQNRGLLKGKQTSQRLGGGSGGFTPETVATLRSLTLAGITFGSVPAAFVPATVTRSQRISGDLGLPILTRFRLIIDYPDHTLFAVPYAGALRAPFAKDRLGLFLRKDGAMGVVQFVSPRSPAQIAGFRYGDEIVRIDGKAVRSWSVATMNDLKYRQRGTTITFEMIDGSRRNVTLEDFF